MEEIPQAEAALIDYVAQQKHLQQSKEIGLSQFALLPKTKKDHAKAKQRLLMALYQFMRQMGLKKRPAIERFCAAVNRGSQTRGLDSEGLDSEDSVGSSNPWFERGEIAKSIELHPAVQAVIPTRFGVQYLSESTLKQWLYGYEREGIIALVSQYNNCGRHAVIAEDS